MSPLDAVLDRPAATSAATAFLEGAPFRVLVVDDAPEVLEALRLLLTPRGFTLVPAHSPAEALAATPPFDAALVDVNFPSGRTSGEQGLDLVSSLLAQHPGLPVVVMTAWSSTDVSVEAMRRGARDFVEKPWDDTRLAIALRAQAELGRALRRITQLESDLQLLRASGGTAPSPSDLKLLDLEGTMVRLAMDRHHGNVSRAARTLGLSRSALYRRLDRHKLRSAISGDSAARSQS